MNRYEYMQRLTYLLRDLPAKDQEDAINYYNDYFDDAQIGLEDEVANTIDSPEMVAQSLGVVSSTTTKVKKPLSGWLITLIVVAVILLFPLWIALFAMAFALFATIFALIFSFILIAFSLLLVGFVSCGTGFGFLLVNLPLSSTLIGLGLIAFSVGLFIFLLEFLVCFKFIPFIFKSIRKLYRLIFKKGEVSYE